MHYLTQVFNMIDSIDNSFLLYKFTMFQPDCWITFAYTLKRDSIINFLNVLENTFVSPNKSFDTDLIGIIAYNLTLPEVH